MAFIPAGGYWGLRVEGCEIRVAFIPAGGYWGLRVEGCEIRVAFSSRVVIN